MVHASPDPHMIMGSRMSSMITPSEWLRFRLRVSSLQATVCLSVHRARSIVIPGLALVLEAPAGDNTTVLSGHLAWQLNELKSQSFSDVPRDVAMHEPGAGVVGLERNHRPARADEHSDVSTGGVLEVEGAEVRDWVECAVALPQYRKVVAVQVHWMGHEELILNDPERPHALFW